MLLTPFNIYIIIFGIQIWLFGMFYTRKMNRFNQCRSWCCINIIWKNSVEYLFNIAANKYKQRNVDQIKPKYRWPRNYWGNLINDNTSIMNSNHNNNTNETDIDGRHIDIVRKLSIHDT